MFLFDTHSVEEAGQHAMSASDELLHHISDANYLEFFGYEIHLPQWHLFGIDISVTKHVVMMWIAMVVLFLFLRFAVRGASLVPRGLANFVEIIVIFIRDEIVFINFGKEGRVYVHYFLTLFFFILTCNLLGLVPQMATATSNISVTAALASISFIVIPGTGIKKQGFFNYSRQIVPSGVPLWLFPIMIPVEIMGMLVKPFALAVRLFANMTAGHVVILALLGLITNLFLFPVIIFPVAISLLEIFIAFLQAYIFTFLTAIFVSSVIHPH